MSQPHRFDLGQLVKVAAVAPASNAPRGVYKIVRQLPPDGDDNLYRVKSELERHERVMPESRLKTLA